MAAQIVITADANPVDEGLRRRLDAMLGLERIGFRARRQPAVVDREAPAFQQMLRLQPIGADMVLHDHAMEDCLFSMCVRSEERRLGEEWVSTGRSRGLAYH